MARAQKLKVYRTPIGFHDAYVAAPSQKAALQAWGSDANLFARGVAEQVTDAALMKEPLAHPGEIIRVLRGTAEERRGSGRKNKAGAKSGPPPSRGVLDEAEAAFAQAEARQRKESARLDDREVELARERRALEQRHEAERKKLEKQLDRARKAYARAVEAANG